MTSTRQPAAPTEDTTARILNALVDVISTDGITEFSVQAVADRAEVSHRTIYRHFPSREALLEGITDFLEDPMRAEGLPGVPEDLDDCVDTIESVFTFFEANAAMIEAMVVVRLALGMEPSRSRERTEGFIDIVRREAPQLSPDEVNGYAMGLRAMASSQHWYVLTRRLGLTTDEASRVTAESLRALIGEIRRRNARQRSKEGS